jgi:hypothetical protein
MPRAQWAGLGLSGSLNTTVRQESGILRCDKGARAEDRVEFVPYIDIWLLGMGFAKGRKDMWKHCSMRR